MRALAVSVILLCVILIYVFSSTAYLSGFFSELLELCSDMPPALDGAEEAAQSPPARRPPCSPSRPP